MADPALARSALRSNSGCRGAPSPASSRVVVMLDLRHRQTDASIASTQQMAPTSRDRPLCRRPDRLIAAGPRCLRPGLTSGAAGIADRPRTGTQDNCSLTASDGSAGSRQFVDGTCGSATAYHMALEDCQCRPRHAFSRLATDGIARTPLRHAAQLRRMRAGRQVVGRFGSTGAIIPCSIAASWCSCASRKPCASIDFTVAST